MRPTYFLRLTSSHGDPVTERVVKVDFARRSLVRLASTAESGADVFALPANVG